MKFTDFVNHQAMSAQLESLDKEDVIHELITGLVNAGEVSADQHEELVERIMEREKMGTTGIGNGVAVPHAKHSAVSRTVGTIGLSSQGVSFDALDGGAVHVLFLLLSPPDQSENHLRVLEKISRHLRENLFCRFLQQAKTDTEIRQVLEDVDNADL